VRKNKLPKVFGVGKGVQQNSGGGFTAYPTEKKSVPNPSDCGKKKKKGGGKFLGKKKNGMSFGGHIRFDTWGGFARGEIQAQKGMKRENNV